MSGLKISELTDGVTPDDADEFATARTGANFRLSWAALRAAIGGSQPVLKTVTFTHATSGYFSGLDLYQAAAGDVLLAAVTYLSIPTAWNGSVPTVSLFMAGTDPSAAAITSADATTANSAFGTFFTLPTLGPSFATLLPAGVLQVAVIDGNTGGDPGSTQGVAKVGVLIATA